MNILIAVTHLLGTGHLSRALTLARAYRDAGHTVTLASGGLGVPQFERTGITFHQLPPLRSDGTNFTRLLTDNGVLADDRYLANRETALLHALTRSAPDILITELFPFGRRILRAEFLALLKAAKSLPNRPAIFASIRDILAPPSKPEKAVKTDALIAQYYDAVLVHSDPARVPLEQSWPVTPALTAKLRYTGYVAPAPAGPHPAKAGEGEIIVSTGGGSVGLALFKTAIEAAHKSPYKWRLLVGGNAPPAWLSELQTLAKSDKIAVETARPDFRKMLFHAKASISMCGYNTALDLLQATTPAILVPFDEGGEVEQSLRAESLAKSSQFRVIHAKNFTADSLLHNLDALTTQPILPVAANYNGATETVHITTEIVTQMRGKTS